MVSMIDVLQQQYQDVAQLLDMIDGQINGKAPLDHDLLHGILEYCPYTDRYHHPKEDLIYRARCEHDQRVEPATGDLEAEVATRPIRCSAKRAPEVSQPAGVRPSEGGRADWRRPQP